MSGTPVKVDDSKKKARIEIIPLIDVIFFLLATFVLFTLSLQRIAQVPVQLPKADPTARPNPDDPTVYIQVSDEGTFYWKVGNNPSPELISQSEIAPRLQDYRNRLGNQARVLVRGDTRARFGSAVMVLDEVRKAGIEQVSVETVSSTTGR